MSVERINKTIDELMWHLVQLDAMTLRQVRLAWNVEDPEARRQAWVVVRDALKRTGREQLMDEARDRVRRWMGDVPVMRGAYNMLGLPGMDEDLPAAKSDAAAAVLDALAVAIVGEFLSEEEREVLQSPFWGEPEA